MKIRITKAGWRRATPGDVVEVPDGVANMLIRRHRAEPHESTDPADVSSSFARKAMAKENHGNNDPIPEGPRTVVDGGRGGRRRQLRRKVGVAADR
jgi:hypothetical protein